MGTMRGQIVGNATRLFDLFLLICCFTLATLRHLGKGQPRSLAQFLSLRIKLEDLVIFATLLLLWHLSFAMHGLYRSKRLASRRGEALDVFRATSLCALILALASWVLDFQWVTPGFVVIFWVCATVTIAASRITIRTLLRRIRQHGATCGTCCWSVPTGGHSNSPNAFKRNRSWVAALLGSRT